MIVIVAAGSCDLFVAGVQLTSFSHAHSLSFNLYVLICLDRSYMCTRKTVCVSVTALNARTRNVNTNLPKSALKSAVYSFEGIKLETLFERLVRDRF